MMRYSETSLVFRCGRGISWPGHHQQPTIHNAVLVVVRRAIACYLTRWSPSQVDAMISLFLAGAGGQIRGCLLGNQEPSQCLVRLSTTSAEGH